jgi:hypothetical protein
MTLPTVVEITPQPEAVTRDTFIDDLTAPTRAGGWELGNRAAGAQHEDLVTLQLRTHRRQRPNQRR